MTPEQDRAMVDRIALVVLDELATDQSWFAAATGAIYRRIEVIRAERKTAPARPVIATCNRILHVVRIGDNEPLRVLQCDMPRDHAGGCTSYVNETIDLRPV
jgi:hypothetical protein